MKLTDIILEQDYYTRFEGKAKDLENEMKDTYNRDDINVGIIQHSNGNKAMGDVSIRVKEALPSIEYQNMKNFISAKGFEITGGANYADDDGDRYFYPNIKFEFDL
jgi:hypothetical protein